ncbi:hypothetical protein E4U11_007230 [Claviceps purpurea]|nr:hypothetical protein E4U11_007230 [Claviceps purpurea]
MGYRVHDDLGASFSMFPLAVASPRLEQLCIGPDVPSLGPEYGPIWREKGQDMWPHLKVLVLHASSPEGEYAITVSTLQFLRCLNRGNSLQYVRFEFSAHELLGGLPNLFGNDLDHKFDVSQYAEFRNLRSLRSERMWISPDGAQPLLSNAINNEQLTSFDIVFPERDPRSVTTLDSSARHLKGYDWFRGTPSIHTLGCYGFSFSPHPKNDDDRLQNLLLPQFLATFPNLRTLHIDSSNYGQDAFAEVILSIMKVTRLKTIYMRLPESEALEKLRKTARFKGIQILWNDYSRQWPVSLES